jgi:pilus assembly protein Flp/PilA
MISRSVNVFHDEDGQGLVEYALIIVLVAIAVIAALTAVGSQIGVVLDNVVTNLGGS